MTHLLRTAAALLMVTCSGPLPASGQTSSSSSGTPLFAADVEVERTVVDSTGTVLERLPKLRYRLSQRERSGDVLTEIQFQSTTPFPGRGPLQDPTAGYRVVMSERHGMQVLDPQGRPVSGPATLPPPGPAPTAPATAGTTRSGSSRAEPVAPQAAAANSARPGPEHAPAIGRGSGQPAPELALPRAAAERRRALQARYGSPAGRQQDRERFVRAEGELTEELVVDASTALPLEVNTRHQGRLVYRSSLSYGTLADGRYYRRVQRDESPTDPSNPDSTRHVITTSLTPVAGGGR